MTAITHSCEYGRITPVRVDTRVCSGFLAFFAAFGIGMPRCHSRGTELLFLSLQFPHVSPQPSPISTFPFSR